MKIQSLSTHPEAGGKSGFIVHKTFLELNNKTALQHSHNNYNWGDGDIFLKKKVYKQLTIKHKMGAIWKCVKSVKSVNNVFLNQFGTLGLRKTWIMQAEL